MWVNAQGSPVDVKPVTVQIELPTETATEQSTPLYAVNFIVVFMALMQVFAALKTGDPVAIMTAVQALINALMGK